MYAEQASIGISVCMQTWPTLTLRTFYRSAFWKNKKNVLHREKLAFSCVSFRYERERRKLEIKKKTRHEKSERRAPH